MTKLDNELTLLRRDMVRMGSYATDITLNAARCVERVDMLLARDVLREDEPIDELRFELDERLIQSLAVNHPMGNDLREIAAAMRICRDLERIGDYAVNVAKSVLRLGADERAWVHPSLQSMAARCADMIEGAMEAYVARNIERARIVSKQDDEVDALYKEIEQYFMTSRPHPASACIHNVLIARAFERVADHSTNICEWVVFEATGVHEEMN